MRSLPVPAAAASRMLAVLVVAPLFMAVPATAAKEKPAASPLVDGRLPRDVVPTRMAVELSIDPRQARFSGKETIDLDVKVATKRVVLHADGLAVKDVVVEQGGKTRKARFAVVDADGVAVLTLDAPLAVGPATLRASFDGPFDQTLRGLYKVVEDGRSYAFTQFEATSARKAFPCFDEPSFKTPWDVTLVVAGDDVAVSNAPAVAEEKTKDGRRVRFATTQPLPSYLIAFAVGPLDVVEVAPIPPNEHRARPLALRGISAKGKGARMAYALRETPAILVALERWFASPYPFDKLDLIAVPDFAAGAMENAGAITFKEQFLHIDEATAPLSQKKSFAGITAHELAHMWFGDLVTMEWWDDLWLNEAFATWMAGKIIAEVKPAYRVDLSTMDRAFTAFAADSLQSARRIRNPITSTGDIHNAFDAITYQKGATVLAMFERWIGPAAFQKGVRAYTREHAYGNATARDLMDALSRASGKDVAAPFSTFLDQSGAPVLRVQTRCDAGKPTLAVAQARWLPVGSAAERARRWTVPLCVRTELARGGSVQTCALLAGETKAIPLAGATCDAVTLPNAGGDGYWRFDVPPEDLGKLVDARARMAPRERVVVADAIRAAQAAGTLPFDRAWSLASHLVDDRERASVAVALELARAARDDLVPERRARVDAAVRAQLARVAKRLGVEKAKDEDAETAMLRADVLSFLALVVDDPAVQADLARRGGAWLGGDVDAVDEELVDAAVAAHVRAGGAPAFDAVLARLDRERDGMTRMRLVAALAATVDDGAQARARALLLDPRLRASEVPVLLARLAADARTKDGTLAWVEQNVDALRARLPGGRQNGSLPRHFGRFCDEAAAARVEALFRPRVGEMVGGGRNLESALESIRLCRAYRDAQVENARRLFAD